VKIRTPLFLIKLFRFEYWSWWVFYLPVLPYFLRLALKERSFKFFSLVNPSIETGGLIGESKIDILNKIPVEYKPKTLFFKSEQLINEDIVLAYLAKNKMHFPIIAKPNVGERGNKVEKIDNLLELISYLNEYKEDLIVQEYIDYPIELGVMYYRLPNEKTGRVTSITMKKFLTVQGDGASTVYALLKNNVRARFQLSRLRKKIPKLLLTVPEKDQEVLIEPIGNHCRGTEFINRNDLIKGEIHEVFDKISYTIEGFYYGRFDLKVKNFDDLYTGNNIKIMELNGVSAEPAHIYDANYPLIRAYKDILHHWRIMNKIYKQNKLKYMS
jgi:hypothetical protein